MLFLEEHLYTLLHTKIMRGHLLGGGGLTGYKCETCLGTGKPWSGLGSYNFYQVCRDVIEGTEEGRKNSGRRKIFGM